MVRHTALLNQEKEQWQDHGYTVTVENQNVFRLRGRMALLVGKPDLIVERRRRRPGHRREDRPRAGLARSAGPDLQVRHRQGEAGVSRPHDCRPSGLPATNHSGSLGERLDNGIHHVIWAR